MTKTLITVETNASEIQSKKTREAAQHFVLSASQQGLEVVRSDEVLRNDSTLLGAFISLTAGEKASTDASITSLKRKGRAMDEPSAVSGEFERASEQDPLAVKAAPLMGGSDQLSIRKEFLDSVATAENAVAQVANNLEKLIRYAQRFTPSDTVDQEVLVGDIDAAIRLGVTLETKGEKLRCLTLQSGRALSWRTSKHGYLGFRKHVIDVGGPL